MKKKHVHKVTLNEKRRQNKKRSDLLKKGVSTESLQNVFDSCYKGPLSALYKRIKEK
jgi:lysine/ornithine N-monooxygenase